MTRGRNRHTMLNKAVKWTDFFCPSYRILELLTLLVKPQKDLVPTMKSACRIFAIQNSIACAICAKCANLPLRTGYFCGKKKKTNRKYDLCQMRKLALANGVLLREKKKKDGARKRHTKEVRKGRKLLVLHSCEMQ